MKISNKDIDKIIDKLLNDFSAFSFINREYLKKLLFNFQYNSFTFEEINVFVDCKKIDNVYYYLIFQAKSILNQILCKKAIEDEELLLKLMIVYGEKIEPYMKKLKIDTNSPLYDQYFEEAITNYDNSKDFELYIVNYLKNRFNGKYVPPKSDKEIVFKYTGRKLESSSEPSVEIPIKEEPTDEYYIIIGGIDTLPKPKKEKVRVVKTEEVTVKHTKPTDKYSYLFNFLGLNNTLGSSDNPEYNLYISLRFNEYYSLKEIEATRKFSNVSLYEYEKYTIERIKEELNKRLVREIDLILN